MDGRPLKEQKRVKKQPTSLSALLPLPCPSSTTLFKCSCFIILLLSFMSLFSLFPPWEAYFPRPSTSLLMVIGIPHETHTSNEWLRSTYNRKHTRSVFLSWWLLLAPSIYLIILSFFITEKYSIVYVYHTFIICSTARLTPSRYCD